MGGRCIGAVGPSERPAGLCLHGTEATSAHARHVFATCAPLWGGESFTTGGAESSSGRELTFARCLA